MDWNTLNKQAKGETFITPKVSTGKSGWDILNSAAQQLISKEEPREFYLERVPEVPEEKDTWLKKIGRFLLPRSLEVKFGLSKPDIKEQMMITEDARLSYLREQEFVKLYQKEITEAPEIPKEYKEPTGFFGQLFEGVKSGYQSSIKAGFGYFTESFGRQLGSRELLKWGQELGDKTTINILKKPELYRPEDLKPFLEGGYGDPRWYGRTIGETMPFIGGTIALATLGGLVGGPPGAIIGGYGSVYALEKGNSYKEMIDKGIAPDKADLSSTVYGAISSAIENAFGIAPAKIGQTIFTKPAKDIIYKSFTSYLKAELPKLAIETLKIAAQEGGEEVAQGITQNLVTKWLDKDGPILTKDLAEEFVAGFVASLPFGVAQVKIPKIEKVVPVIEPVFTKIEPKPIVEPTPKIVPEAPEGVVEAIPVEKRVEIPVIGKKLTNRDVYEIVNSIKPVPIDETPMSIKFNFVADSRWIKDMGKEIDRLKGEFIEKADKYGLEYKISDVRDLKFPPDIEGGEPTYQKRITIYITKPKYAKEIIPEVKPIPKELEPLAVEARKYKSAEEFVKKADFYWQDQRAMGGGEPYVEITINGKPAGMIIESEAMPIPKTAKGLAAIPEQGKYGVVDSLGNPIGVFDTNTEAENALKSQLSDFYNQAVKGVKEVKPGVVKPEGKPAKVAISIEAKAKEMGIAKQFEGLAEYEPVVIKEQMKKIEKLMNENIEKAKRMATGEEALDKDIKGAMLVKMIEDYAMENRDGDLILALANSPLVSETSEAGQTLRLIRERVPDSATARIQEVKKIREEVAEKKRRGKSKTEIKDNMKKGLKETIDKNAKKISKYSWLTLIDEITC